MDLDRIQAKYNIEIPVKKLKALERVVFDGLSKADAGRELGIRRETVGQWAKEPWWKEIENEYVTQSYDSFKNKMLTNAERIFDKAMTVMDEEGPATAMAKVKMLQLVAEAGDKPLINRKAGDINVNLDNRSITIGELDMKKIEGATPEVLKEIALGNIPPEFRKD